MVRVRLLVLGIGGGGAAPICGYGDLVLVFFVLWICSSDGGYGDFRGGSPVCEVHGIGVESGVVVWLRFLVSGWTLLHWC
ncbi:hypothetical protein P8452_13092 [Trifolium repens]|nr:hypothetical protein P8452_13092 [Trifolium repens]